MTSAFFLFLAAALDRLLGEPRRWHPLVGFGTLVSALERRVHPPHAAPRAPWRSKRLPDFARQALRVRGVAAITLLLIPPTLIAAWLARQPIVGPLSSVAFLYLALGARSLTQHARAVEQALADNNLELARQRVALIVSRNTAELDATSVTRATIESVLENGSDAVFAALFWFLVLGAPGAVLYRLANTLDAMWGYRNPRYQYFGWAAARFDDLMNFIPARLCALTYILLGNTQNGWRCWRAQAATWYSPNAGPVMAAGAGALGVQLGGNAHYHGQLKQRPQLGSTRVPEHADILRATDLVNRGLWLWVAVANAGALILGAWHA